MSTTLPLALYGAATAMLEPLVPSLLASRARRGREDAARLGERLGRPGAPRPAGPLVWLHGVSVGESLSLLPLVEGLKAARPDLALLVTSGTATAQRLLQQRLPPGVIHQYAPVDAPAAARRFLAHWRPGLVVLAESELWPNLILRARASGARLALVSARMTEASATGWSRVPRSARRLLSAFDLILPQDVATEARLRRLGAEPGPLFNLKRLGQPLPCPPDALAQLRDQLGDRPVILAASTHPGEEAMITAAARAAEPRALLVLAVRHPDRGPSVAAALAPELRTRLRSRGETPEADTQVYVADTLGELGLFLRLADVVIMGGSFAPGVGGHNPLEAARLGHAVITGPNVFNAADLYAEMHAQACAVTAAGADDLTRHVQGLLEHPRVRRRMGEAARAYADRQGEALEMTLARLTPLLPP